MLEEIKRKKLRRKILRCAKKHGYSPFSCFVDCKRYICKYHPDIKQLEAMDEGTTP